MVNQQLVRYIQQQKGSYPIETLKKSLISQGYSAAEVQEAAGIASGKAPPLISSGSTKAWIAYLFGWISGLIVYLTADDNFQKFNGLQSIFLNIALGAIYLAVAIMMPILAIISYRLMFLSAILYPLVAVGYLVLIIILMINASKGKTIMLPLIGQWAMNVAEKR